MKILLVDDERFAIEGLISMLNWESFQGELIGTAASGTEAIELMKFTRPDVVISDIKMEGMDGVKLAEYIYHNYREVKIIFLTAHEEFEFARRAIRYGVIDYILKPVTREKISNLEHLLAEYNSGLEKSRRNYLKAWDSSLKEKLQAALRSGEVGMLDEFFKSAAFSELLEGDNCNTAGIQLIDYLYQYLQEINVRQDALEYSRNQTMQTFLEIPDHKGKTDFIITKYYDLFSSINSQKRSHTEMIKTYVFRYIEEHYTDPEFSLTALSDSMHISLSHLSTLFKHVTGNNLSSYVVELRIEKAKELLADMKYSVAEAGVNSGYPDAKYFAKLFKKKMGMTPSEYRNLIVQGGLDGHQT